MTQGRWQIWIDRGGTFTDCIGQRPEGGPLHVVKVLSTDDAVTVGIRRLMGLADGEPIPPCDLRLGTTVATNALLERRGDATLLITSRGFADALEIGDQTRPRLFGLHIDKPVPLYAQVIEVDRRCYPDGRIDDAVDLEEFRLALRAAKASGITAVAIVLLHSYAAPDSELSLAAVAASVGFAAISCSADLAPEIGLVARGQTTVVDAYVSPVLSRYLGRLAADLPGSSIALMQSSGGLADIKSFRGKDAILSGPAGGAIAYAGIAQTLAQARAIGFDMGGTSTDVSCFDGELDRVYEATVADAPLRAPMIDLHTVAAGGGSVCGYDGIRLTVGPRSAGAIPGPLCYGHPDAEDLTLTDVNLILGRLVADEFPFALDVGRARAKLTTIADKIGLTIQETAEGFAEIANANMAAAIRRVTIARGRDVRQFALHVFGGAGGQHACGVARALDIETLVFHPLAGVLSAYGMGIAPRSVALEADAGRSILSAEAVADALAVAAQLERQARETLTQGLGVPVPELESSYRVDLRYQGTESAIAVPLPRPTAADRPDQAAAHARIMAALCAAFAARHKEQFGYEQNAPLEVCVVRIEVRTRLVPASHRVADQPRAKAARGATEAAGPVWDRAELSPGMRLAGPAVVIDPTGCIYVEEGFVAERSRDDLIIVSRANSSASRVGNAEPPSSLPRVSSTLTSPPPDPILREVLGNAYMDIARRMGEVLRRTAVSTNIRDRLDFSCAVFDRGGALVANAPHIPVHLGAMGETVKAVLAAHPKLCPGDAFASNDPFAGGSHLPDITVVTPVHNANGELAYVVASRGHHADIGGLTPGSMPPFSTTISEEGVLLTAMPIVRNGVFDEAGLRTMLRAGPHPARQPEEVIRDLRAQLAANQAGITAMGELIARHGEAATLAMMESVIDQGAALVAAAIGRLGDGDYHFADSLDDGARIEVHIAIRGETMDIDFAGSGPQHPGNLNAPRAVTLAAILYVLRSLVDEDIPLNAGCLRPVTVRIPPDSVLDPRPGAAVVAGNVETSQRVVDVLLGALGLAAASQGTMNNVTFGNAAFGYYETLAGGAGATASHHGASAVHTHMTNTRITDVEVLEARYPVEVRRFSIRRGSGGAGAHRGGDGLVRSWIARAPLAVSVLSERRLTQPFGLAGGEPGAPGRCLRGATELPGRAAFTLEPGEVFTVQTPGGGGFGRP